MAALTGALEDEDKARATCARVIEAFGPAQPLVNILESEERHAQARLALFRRDGPSRPEDRWRGRVPAPASVAAARGAAVATSRGRSRAIPEAGSGSPAARARLAPRRQQDQCLDQHREGEGKIDITFRNVEVEPVGDQHRANQQQKGKRKNLDAEMAVSRSH